MRTLPKLFIENLKRCVAYDPETGTITWKALLSSKSRAVIGAEIGRVEKEGYIRFKFMGIRLLVHQAAWVIMKGEWPPSEIDHWDIDPGNNRWLNLRLATRSQNKANMHPPITNTSGIKGVRYEADRGKWLAAIRYDGKRHFLGRFLTKEEAAAAYAKAAIAHFGEFARVPHCS